MKECDNSKIHISSNFILFICLLIMLDTFLLRVFTQKIIHEEENEIAVRFPFWFCIPHWASYLFTAVANLLLQC